VGSAQESGPGATSEALEDILRAFVSKRERRISARIRRLKKGLAQIQQAQSHHITESPRNLSRHAHIDKDKTLEEVTPAAVVVVPMAPWLRSGLTPRENGTYDLGYRFESVSFADFKASLL
jgi:hypothetical protein